jgi:hypothetical protein
MPTLNEVTFAAASLITNVYQDTATSGTDSTIVDTKLAAETETYLSGTVWILSGTNAGACRVVDSHTQNILHMREALPAAIIAGDVYAVITKEWPKTLLDLAVRAVLQFVKVPVETTATAVNGELTLPIGVYDIKQCWFGGKENYHWEETGGKIKFDSSSVNGTVTLKYKQQATTLTDFATGVVSDYVPLELLTWSMVAYLWRNRIEQVRKDNPIATDLLNEAKTNEAFAKAKAEHYNIDLVRSPRYAKWSV